MKYMLLLHLIGLSLVAPIFEIWGHQELVFFTKKAENQIFMEQPQCLTAENYTLTLRYAKWKLKTAKRLSTNRRVLFGKGFEYTIREEENAAKSIVFYKKNVEAFFVSAAELTSLDKKLELSQCHQLFCELFARAKSANLPHNVVYRYHDGSNNVWSIGPQKIVYRPITPAMSSSGIYSGGDPFEKAISAPQFAEIEALLKIAAVNKMNPGGARSMGSGMIVECITDALAGDSYLLPMRATEKSAIEAWLNQLK